MAKGIASGLPLSGIIARRELIDALGAGHPWRDVRRQRRRLRRRERDARRHRDEGLVANAAARGDQFLAGLRALAGEVPLDRRRPRAGPHAGPRVRQSRARATDASPTRP